MSSGASVHPRNNRRSSGTPRHFHGFSRIRRERTSPDLRPPGCSWVRPSVPPFPFGSRGGCWRCWRWRTPGRGRNRRSCSPSCTRGPTGRKIHPHWALPSSGRACIQTIVCSFFFSSLKNCSICSTTLFSMVQLNYRAHFGGIESGLEDSQCVCNCGLYENESDGEILLAPY